jgi:hypothetical protein
MVPKRKFPTITLYVPEGCVDVYKSAVEWRNFTNIIEKKTIGIEEMRSDRPDARGGLFDLQGRRLTDKPGKGVYIQSGKKRVVK